MFDPTTLKIGGYRPDPPKLSGEKPDKVFSTELKPKLKMIDFGDVDLTVHTTQTDQLHAGACVGNATADAVEILNSIEGLPHVQLSRLFIYSMCRTIMDADGDGRADLDKDDGTYIRLAFDVLSKFGVCREDLPEAKGGWPYDLSKLHKSPSIKAMRAATGHRIHSYYRITETGDERLERIVEALRAHRPVVFGTQIGEEFKALKDEGPVSIPRGNLLGGHAMIVIGYISNVGFIVKNSWGINWGDYGRCIMTPEYLAWSQTQDLWVPTKGSEFR